MSTLTFQEPWYVATHKDITRFPFKNCEIDYGELVNSKNAEDEDDSFVLPTVLTSQLKYIQIQQMKAVMKTLVREKKFSWCTGTSITDNSTKYENANEKTLPPP